MTNTFGKVALVFGLVGAIGLVTAPAGANAKSIQRDGYFGGTWSPIGPRDNRHVRRHYKKWAPRGRAFYGPRYGSYYGPRYGYPRYYYGPGYYPRGGVSFGFSVR